MRRGRQQGSTIAECLFTLALCAIVVGSATLMYGSVASGAIDSAALLDTSDGDDRIARELQFLVSNSIAAEVKTIAGRSVLKLTMPAVRGARNANGLYDSYGASFLHPRVGNAYLAGERVWIYSGITTDGVASAGTVPCLARRADDATPTMTDVDWNWTFRDGDGKKIRRASAPVTMVFSFSDPVVTWSISSIQADGTTERSLDKSNAATYRDLTVTGATMLRQAAPQ